MDRQLRLLARVPLALVCAQLFALSPTTAFAAPAAVTNCANSGTGSLRSSVASAVNNDTITIPNTLGCSTISLTTGAITIPSSVSNLTITGPGAGLLAVEHGNGSPADRVFDHQGTGIFRLQALTVRYGNPTAAGGSVDGGCIRSSGTVTLQNSTVEYCRARGLTYGARGGAVYAKNVNVKYSNVSGNDATGADFVRGGAIYANSLLAKYSNITENGAYSSGSASFLGSGGGAYITNGAITILSSNVSYNNTSGNGGGISHFIIGTGTSLQLTNSTVSHNYAGHTIGGVYTDAPTKIYNSTIAFNSAAQDYTGTHHHAPGLSVEEAGYALTVKLVSSIFSNNTYGTINDDISTVQFGIYTVTISGNNNLVYSNFASTTLPAGTIRFSCPLLGSLRDNGGLTQTIALMSRSPAIDAGAATEMYDQRNNPYLRLSGPAPDIGAYEVQQGDIVFNANFQGCPAIF